MSRRRSEPRPWIVLDFGGVLSAGHDPVPELHELLGGNVEALTEAFWRERVAYDRGALRREEYWARVAAAVGVQDLTADQVAELQETDDRYWLRLDSASRELLHDLARSEARLALLSNASEAFGEAVRQADWFEAFSFAVISGEEKCLKPEPEIYEILLEVIAHESGGVTRPRSVVFFDDREENVAAARALGIDAHHWPRNGEQTRAGESGQQIARRVLADRGVVLD